MATGQILARSYPAIYDFSLKPRLRRSATCFTLDRPPTPRPVCRLALTG
ncbi:MAG: hypothetical protein L0332_17970 [Chloroflexi bacterium]|nr:hypothetical protein [Chloroflexota bacterium]MCI0728588.1 hypothetical protein [Chloroflexota bacterium]